MPTLLEVDEPRLNQPLNRLIQRLIGLFIAYTSPKSLLLTCQYIIYYVFINNINVFTRFIVHYKSRDWIYILFTTQLNLILSVRY